MADNTPQNVGLSSGWLGERRRLLVGLGAAALTLLVVLVVAREERIFSGWDGGVLVLLAYLVAYLAVTIGAFSAASQGDIEQWAERDERGSVLQRYLLGTAPGPGVSLAIAAGAMAVATVWLPGYGGTELPSGLRIGIAVTLVVVAWLCVLISFAVAFHADNLIEDKKALDFPGESSAGWSDHVYFAMAVMTTFGTTDVSVTSPALRRTVTVNAVIAFVFNTVTVAAVVSALIG